MDDLDQELSERISTNGGRMLNFSHPILAPLTELEPDPELVAQGWERRFMAGPGRAQEAIKLYSELGYEVHTEPVKPKDLSDECQDCRLATSFFVTLYTRKRSNQSR